MRLAHCVMDFLRIACTDLAAEYAHDTRTTQYGGRTQTTPKTTDIAAQSRHSREQAILRNEVVEPEGLQNEIREPR